MKTKYLISISLELQNAAFFDLNADGFHELASWISETDAFLVLDKNFNGIVDNGSELFVDAMILPDGSRALTGFDALRFYDSNNDGKIDVNDDIYVSLKVMTGKGEIASLADAGIKSITVPPPVPGISLGVVISPEGGNSGSSTSVVIDPWAGFTWEERVQATIDQARAADEARRQNGGTFGAESVFEWEDGGTGKIAEAYPYRVPMMSILDEYLEVPEDMAALPDLMGSSLFPGMAVTGR